MGVQSVHWRLSSKTRLSVVVAVALLSLGGYAIWKRGAAAQARGHWATAKAPSLDESGAFRAEVSAKVPPGAISQASESLDNGADGRCAKVGVFDVELGPNEVPRGAWLSDSGTGPTLVLIGERLGDSTLVRVDAGPDGALPVVWLKTGNALCHTRTAASRMVNVVLPTIPTPTPTPVDAERLAPPAGPSVPLEPKIDGAMLPRLRQLSGIIKGLSRRDGGTGGRGALPDPSTAPAH